MVTGRELPGPGGAGRGSVLFRYRAEILGLLPAVEVSGHHWNRFRGGHVRFIRGHRQEIPQDFRVAGRIMVRAMVRGTYDIFPGAAAPGANGGAGLYA